MANANSSAALQANSTGTTGTIVAVADIIVGPDRRRLRPETVDQLAESIAAQGLLHPLTLRKRASDGAHEQIDEEELTARDLNQVRKLAEASKRTTLSPDTLKRTYPHYIVQLSPRRLGMTERNIQRIATGGK
jgi:hypothetical protein